jgi:hypothetical protein
VASFIQRQIKIGTLAPSGKPWSVENSERRTREAHAADLFRRHEAAKQDLWRRQEAAKRFILAAHGFGIRAELSPDTRTWVARGLAANGWPVKLAPPEVKVWTHPDNWYPATTVSFDQPARPVWRGATGERWTCPRDMGGDEQLALVWSTL